MGKRKAHAVSCSGECARSVQTVGAAHPVERTTQEEVVLATSGACLDATRRRTLSGVAGQRVDDVQSAR